jgi:hypothetical protein
MVGLMDDVFVTCPVCFARLLPKDKIVPLHNMSTYGAGEVSETCYGSLMPVFEGTVSKNGKKKIQAGNIFFIPRYEDYELGEDDGEEQPEETGSQTSSFKRIKKPKNYSSRDFGYPDLSRYGTPRDVPDIRTKVDIVDAGPGLPGETPGQSN